MADDPFTRRTEDAFAPTRTRRRWIFTIALALTAAGATAAVMKTTETRQPRYQLQKTAAGITARLDTTTGEMVFFGPAGHIVRTYPTADTAPAFDPFKNGQATPDK